MKRSQIVAALATSFGIAVGSAAIAQDVTVKIGEPGYVGRVEIGDAPKPILISPNPIIIERERLVEQPTYVYVPAEQRKDWARYCGRYDACSRPVYFVEERWYTDVYVPHYKSKHQIKREAKAEYKDEKQEAKREYKDAKEQAKRDYKDAKEEANERR